MANQFVKLLEKMPEIDSGETYYRTYTQKLKDLMIGGPNIWFYPAVSTAIHGADISMMRITA